MLILPEVTGTKYYSKFKEDKMAERKVNVAIVNISERLRHKEKDLYAAVAALQIQVTRDFAHVWGRDADLWTVYDGHLNEPLRNMGDDPCWWLLVLQDTPNRRDLVAADGTLIQGYHDVTNDGLPLGKVFVEKGGALDPKWTVTASH